VNQPILGSLIHKGAKIRKIMVNPAKKLFAGRVKRAFFAKRVAFGPRSLKNCRTEAPLSVSENEL
jgi:hypothetical protein